MMTPLDRWVCRLIRKHGGVRSAGRALDVDPAYLYRLATGEKDNPSDATLKKLGLKPMRKVLYLTRGKP